MKRKTHILPLTFVAAAFAISCEKKEVVVHNPNTETQSSETQTIEQVPGDVTNSATFKDIPQTIKTFLDEHYAKVPIVKYEKKTETFDGTSYEVRLNSGVKAEFDDKGNWKEIEDAAGVPKSLISKEVQTYFDTNFKGITIKKIEKDKKSIKAELANGTEYEFDQNGKFIKMDP